MSYPPPIAVHYNTENEKLTIEKATSKAFEGQYLLCLFDDPPPLGSGVRAPMLLDEGTRQFLLAELGKLGTL